MFYFNFNKFLNKIFKFNILKYLYENVIHLLIFLNLYIFNLQNIKYINKTANKNK